MDHSRRELLKYAILFSSFTGLQCSSSQINPDLKPIFPTPMPILPSFIDLTKNIGEIILDLEQWGGAPVPEFCYHELQNIITSAELQLKYKVPLATLQGINKILREEERYFMGGDVLLLSEALATKKMDCDTASFVYLAIGEQLKLPLYGVRSPHHFFIRWHLDGDYIDWETTIGEQTNDSFYKEKQDILDDAVAKGIYLKSLSREETFSLPFNNIATHLRNQKKNKEALVYFDLSLRCLPVNCEAINNYGTALSELGRHDDAIAEYDNAIELDPRQVIPYYNKAVVLEDLHRYSDAIQLYDAILEMFPQNKYLDLILERRERAHKYILTP